jgi:hypothetical protein
VTEKKRGKLKGFVVLVFLILILGTVDSAWIFYHERTITTNVIGGEGTYTISQEFDNSISLDTSNGNANVTTLMTIDDLNHDMNMSFEIETRKTNLNSNCSRYDKDCRIIVTHKYNLTNNILSDKTENITTSDKKNLILHSPLTNYIEYRIECVKNSCNQRINSNITLNETR